MTFINSVIADLMDKGFEFDLNDFMTDREQAEFLGEILSTLSSYQDDEGLNFLENKHEQLTQLKEFISNYLKFFVERKYG